MAIRHSTCVSNPPHRTSWARSHGLVWLVAAACLWPTSLAGEVGHEEQAGATPWQDQVLRELAELKAELAQIAELLKNAIPNLGPSSTPVPPDPIPFPKGATKGDLGAHVGIIEYSDFECPFCGAFARDTLPSLDRIYVRTGKVLLGFRHLPLIEIHRHALAAADGAECAAKQDRFWQMHDALFADQLHLEPPDLSRRAETIGLEIAAFDACVKGGVSVNVAQDAADAHSLGVTVTPTFFIGTIEGTNLLRVTTVVTGSKPLSTFVEAFDSLLKKSLH
jgi:protein-disulfide isomerase